MNPSSTRLPDIQKTIVASAPIDKVWRAVSTAEGLSGWFMPNDIAPTVGHRFQINAAQFGMSPCEVTIVEPPYRIGFNWGKDWHLLFELTEIDPMQTQITLTHSGWDSDQVTEFGQPHPMIREIMDGGWGGMVKALGLYVEA